MYYLVYYPAAGIGALGGMGIILAIVVVVFLLGMGATVGFSWSLMSLDFVASMLDQGWWLILLVLLAVCAAANWFLGKELQSWFPLAPLGLSVASWVVVLLIALVYDVVTGDPPGFWTALFVCTIGLVLLTLMFYPLFLGMMAITSPLGLRGGGKKYVFGALCTFGGFVLGMLTLQAAVEVVWGWFGAAGDVALRHVRALQTAMDLFFDEGEPLRSGTWMTDGLLNVLKAIPAGWRFLLCLVGCVGCTYGEAKFVGMLDDIF